MPVVGLEGGKINIVPVDFVAAAMDHIAHQAASTDRRSISPTPRPKSAGQVINTFARAAHAPEFAMRIDRQMTNVVPKQARKMIAQLPPVKSITDQVLGDFGIPRETLSYIDYPSDYDSRDTQRALEGTGIQVPSLDGYADRLWDYWERNLDPDLFKDRSLRGAVEGKVVVITGASSGIGARARAAASARPAASCCWSRARRTSSRRRRPRSRRWAARAHVHPADLSDLEDCDRLVEEILREHGRVDILVNNAGRSIRRSIENSYDRFHDYQRTMQLNYFGALKLILGFLPGMRERKFGPHHQRLLDRRADQHAALLGLRREQERARRVLALDRFGDRRRQRPHHDHLHAAGEDADDRADRDLRRLPDRLAGRGRRHDLAAP